MQQQLGRNFILDVDYFGSKSTHLLGIVDMNEVPPGLGIAGGLPTDIRVAVVPPTFATFNVRDRVSGLDMYAHQGVDQYFNPAAFSVPGTVLSNAGAPIQLFGNSARRVGRGQGSVNTDFSAFKNIRITEGPLCNFGRSSSI